MSAIRIQGQRIRVDRDVAGRRSSADRSVEMDIVKRAHPHSGDIDRSRSCGGDRPPVFGAHPVGGRGGRAGDIDRPIDAAHGAVRTKNMNPVTARAPAAGSQDRDRGCRCASPGGSDPPRHAHALVVATAGSRPGLAGDQNVAVDGCRVRVRHVDAHDPRSPGSRDPVQGDRTRIGAGAGGFHGRPGENHPPVLRCPCPHRRSR